jgi:hypothetical protein
MIKEELVRALVGKTIEDVHCPNRADLSVQIDFTDGTSFSFTNLSAPKLDLTYYFGELDEEVVTDVLEGRR